MRACVYLCVSARTSVCWWLLLNVVYFYVFIFCVAFLSCVCFFLFFLPHCFVYLCAQLLYIVLFSNIVISIMSVRLLVSMLSLSRSLFSMVHTHLAHLIFLLNGFFSWIFFCETLYMRGGPFYLVSGIVCMSVYIII